MVLYNFEGRYDIVKFVKLITEVGLYVHLRISTYSVLNGTTGKGFPLWLYFVLGIELRTDNEPYKVFTMPILCFHFVDYWRNFMPLKDPSFYHRLKMSMETLIRPTATTKSYIKWVASMVVSQDTIP
ncbi:hypothetical protein Patl1_10734 [Pistacia atlantica]|uniref:Uncharacterized protein n=1 Tax=Pistacia atlantica TaxID=434234 RepID=A0ACC1A8V6_9ROSI|nr:hypothetical protein Patl1_10734 [Pistacia atlantica]